MLDERLADLQRSNTFVLRSTPDADIESLLQSLSVTTSVARKDSGNWQVEVSGELDPAAEAIAAAMVGGGHSLFELKLLKRDLETVFREVNEETQDAA